VTLGESLAIRLAVVNRDEKPLSFQVALHTYFRVADIRRVGVLGLQGVELSDSLRQGAREKESREVIAFDRETDRIYRAAPGKLAIRDGAGARVIRLEKSGLADAVVWNPWIEKSRRMEDFGDEEYQTMVCVETGNISEPVKLDPERRWEGATVFYSQPLLKPARP
jgi:glucose-6-phosphate 1-epimerase